MRPIDRGATETSMTHYLASGFEDAAKLLVAMAVFESVAFD